MASPYDDLVNTLTQAGGYLFGPGTQNLSYESLQRRRAIAQALASKRSKFPTNVGEGLTYFGEQLGDILAERRTDAAEKAYMENRQGLLDPSKAPSLADDVAAPAAPAAPAATTPGPVSHFDPADPNTQLADEPVARQVARANALDQGAVAAVPPPAAITPQGPMPGPGAGVGALQARLPPQPAAPPAAAAQTPRGVVGSPQGRFPLGPMDAEAPAGAPAATAPDELRDRVAAAVRLQDAAQMGAAPSALAPRSDITYPPTAAAQTGVMSDAPPMGARAAPGLTGAPDARAAATNALVAQNAPAAPAAPPGPQLAQAGPAPAPVPAPQVLPPPRGQMPPGVPGPLSPPVQPPPGERVPRTGVPSQPEFERPLNLTPPRPTPLTPHELYGQGLLRDPRAFGDPLVQQRAQEYITFGAARRKFQDETNLKEWEKNRELQKQREEQRVNAPKVEMELRAKEQELRDKDITQQQALRYGGMRPEFVETMLKESREATKTLPNSVTSINNALSMLEGDKKMFTGSDAEIRLSMAKLGAALGLPVNPKIATTEQFQSMVAPIVAQLRTMLVGNQAVSDADRQAAEKAAAGKITLEPESIRGVLGAIQRMSVLAAVDHQRKLLTVAGTDENAQRLLFNTMGLSMEVIVPQAAVADLRRQARDPDALREFDETFQTPGLAVRVLRSRR